MYIPCGKMNMPAPKLLTIWPDSSNFMITSTFEIVPVCAFKQEFAPQRSATHRLLPSLSMATALVDPQTRPAGSFANPSMVW